MWALALGLTWLAWLPLVGRLAWLQICTSIDAARMMDGELESEQLQHTCSGKPGG